MRTEVRFAMWVLLLGTGLAVGTTGCLATRRYVDEGDIGLKSALAARLDALERDAKATRAELAAVTTRVATAENRMETAENRIGTAENRIGTSENRLGSAETRLTQTQAKADEVGGTLNLSLANRFKREKVQEVTLLFPTGKDTLPKDAHTVIDDLVTKMASNPTYTLDVVGYADVTGPGRYNMNLSWRRSEMVRRRLVDSGVDMNRVYFIGFGEEMAKGKTAAEMQHDRQVAIRVFKPTN